MIDTHIPMFDGNLTELDTNKLDFIYWLRFYNSNYFSKPEEERPNNFVFNYDILFDDWLDKKEFSEKSKTSSRERASAREMNHVIEFD